MSWKPQKPSDFWKSEAAKKSEVGAKTAAFRLSLPNEEITIKGEKFNYFAFLVKELAKNHEDVFHKVGCLDLDLLWEKSECSFAKKGRSLEKDGKTLFELYPKPFQGCKLYEGDIAMENVSFWNNDLSKFIPVMIGDKQVKNLGGIHDQFEGDIIENKDKDGKLISIQYKNRDKLKPSNYNGVKIRLNSYNILITDGFGKPLSDPKEGETFQFFEVNGKCNAETREEILKYDQLLTHYNETNPDEQYQKLDCFFVTDELKDPPVGGKSKSPKHSMFIQMIVFM